LAESEEFDAVVKTILDVGPVNLEYLCWLFGLEYGGSAETNLYHFVEAKAKERKFATKSFTTISSGDSITSQNDEILELEQRLASSVTQKYQNFDFLGEIVEILFL
jgi:hypothetical protein